jgi:SIR2-like domain
MSDLIADIARQLDSGGVIPYMGAGMLSLCEGVQVPATPAALAAVMTAKVSVPHKVRSKLTQAAQFIENFKHRKSVVMLMDEAFATAPVPSPLHLALAGSGATLFVDTWYDDTMLAAMKAARPQGGWHQLQGLSQSEHFGQWTADYDAEGHIADTPATDATPLLYRPIGGRSPVGNYLVSDSDYVEVLTEIDIQTPIPAVVQERRKGRHFLFIGCRFDDQLTRSFARQIMKRSSDTHWAVLPEEPTRMEARFLEEQGITRIPMTLPAFGQSLTEALQAELAAP